MAEVKWIKLFIDIWDNRKIKQIETLPDGDTVLVIWLKLLTLAGNINDGGMVYFTKDLPYTEEMLATHFGKPLPTVKMALDVFQRFGMIEIVNNILCVTNWEKYQNRERLDDLKEYNRLKQREHRQRVNELSMKSIDSQDIERRKKIEDSREKNNNNGARFVPPTPEEVQAYCDERDNHINANEFVDFYSSKGWMIGKNKMKDWKAAVRTWESKRKQVHQSDIEMGGIEDKEMSFDEIQEALFGGS